MIIRQEQIQFIKFCIIGCINTSINFVIFYSLVLLGTNYRLAGLGGFLVGAIISFIFNRKYTFSKENKNGSYFAKFLVVQIACAILHLSTITLFVNYIYNDVNVAQVLGISITTVVNFLCQRIWVFR